MAEQHGGASGGHELSDEEVLFRWLSEPDEDGALTLVVFRRYRVAVRRELESAGLLPREAVQTVATVLLRARNARPEKTLRDRLLNVAREVVEAMRQEGEESIPACDFRAPDHGLLPQ